MNGPRAREFSPGGAAYVPTLDRAWLSAQIERIRRYMLDVEWRTLREIKTALEAMYAPTAFPESSISAQLRNLKGHYSYRLLKRRRTGIHGPGAGIWEYRLLPPEPRPQFGLFVEKQSEQPPLAAARVDVGSEPDDGREEFFRAARWLASQASK